MNPVYYAIGGFNVLGKFQLGEPSLDIEPLQAAMETIGKHYPAEVNGLAIYEIKAVVP